MCSPCSKPQLASSPGTTGWRWARGASLRRKPLIPLASTGSGGLATHAAALTRFSRSSTTPLGTAPSAEARHLRRSLPTPPASSPKRPRMSQDPRVHPPPPATWTPQLSAQITRRLLSDRILFFAGRSLSSAPHVPSFVASRVFSSSQPFKKSPNPPFDVNHLLM
jgi:hypothetical protein